MLIHAVLAAKKQLFQSHVARLPYDTAPTNEFVAHLACIIVADAEYDLTLTCGADAAASTNMIAYFLQRIAHGTGHIHPEVMLFVHHECVSPIRFTGETFDVTGFCRVCHV